MQPDELSLDTPIEAMDAPLLVETELGRTLVTRSGSEGGYAIEAHLPDGRRRKLVDVPAARSVRDTVASLSSARPLRAFRLPGATVRAHTNPFLFVLSYLPLVLGTAAAFTGAMWESLGLLRLVLLTVGVTLLVVGVDALKKSQRYRQWGVQRGGDRLKAIDVPLPDLPEEIEVDDVKAEYGRLLSDIAYRIEYPALFDPHEPTSKAFTLALLRWDNNDGIVGDDERRELARRVRVTFEAARANAEAIGMDHIPEESRDRAATALKAARLATDEASPAAERETALRSAIEILDQLALYYLPSGAEARRAITGGTPPALPGRRSGQS